MRTQNSYYPYEPVQILGDANCLHRSVSIALFGNENKWDLIKLGSLSYLKTSTDAVLQYVRDSTLFVKNFPKRSRLYVQKRVIYFLDLKICQVQLYVNRSIFLMQSRQCTLHFMFSLNDSCLSIYLFIYLFIVLLFLCFSFSFQYPFLRIHQRLVKVFKICFVSQNQLVLESLFSVKRCRQPRFAQ